MSRASGRAWECALILSERRHLLTSQQALDVEIALMAGPDEADPALIALAVRTLEART